MIKRPALAPYVVGSDPTSQQELLRRCNEAVYGNYSPDYTVGPGVGKVVVDPLVHYERLLRLLASIPNVEFLTMEELITGRGRPDSVRVTIRHDIDADIVTALLMARMEQAHGIRSTHFLLHTAYYYGHFRDGVFHRYEAMGPFYRRIQEHGHEVGLHIDPLLVYQDHRIDGAQALVTELAWLRSLGLRIVGCAAHNHTSVYGAQNYEVFKGKSRNHHMPGGDDEEIIDADEVEHHGKWAPLHVLDMDEIGVSYEAHDTYAIDGFLGIMAEIGYGTINQLWNCRREPAARGMRSGPGDWDAMVAALEKVRPGEAIVFTTHPLYYGSRHRPEAEPPLRLDEISVFRNPSLGWTTYRPRSLVAVPGGRRGDEACTQSISFANELGLLDRPIVSDADVKILVLGAENLDARWIGIPDHLSSRLETALAGLIDGTVAARTLAFPGMGVARHAWWYDRLDARMKPSIVLMGIDRDAVRNNHPAWWPPGAEAPHPAERHLAWSDASEDVELVAPVDPVLANGPAPELARLGEGEVAGGVPFVRFLESSYRFLADRVRADGGVPYLLVENDGGVDGGGADAGARVVFAERVRRIAAAAGVACVDPHPALDAHEGPGRARTDDGRWTAIGHRLAAGQIARAIASGPRPSPRAATRRPAVTVVNIHSLSYTGTTWINIVLGSHPRAFAVGPPERFLNLVDSDPGNLCLVHGGDCIFWPSFCAAYDPARNFFIQLAEHTGRDHIVINNPTPTGLGPQLDHPDVRVKTIHVVRDGRAVSASYARKFGVPYADALRWFAPAIRHFPYQSSDGDDAFLRYEDLVDDPDAALDRIGGFLQLHYDRSALRYWEFDHHPISGNQGMYAMMKLHHGLPVGSFESRRFYEARHRSGVERQGRPLKDDRWSTQLTRRERFAFECVCGADNARMGYAPDVFTDEERQRWEPEMRARFGDPVSIDAGDPTVTPPWRRFKEALPAPVIRIARRAKRLLKR